MKPPSHFCHLLFGLYHECPPLYGNLFVFRPHGLQRCDINTYLDTTIITERTLVLKGQSMSLPNRFNDQINPSDLLVHFMVRDFDHTFFIIFF